ncbi:MAG: hypothetical protein QM330_13225 [Acidobacteriota bacterium]|jgi:hypothetical protein|nr:hypothetical protein [Acidobacteriota bacterium]NLT32724.1 hypothetical protein [Acidobacteriota bacterium]
MFSRKNVVLMSVLFVFLLSLPLMAAQKGSARVTLTKAVFVAGTETEIKAGKYDAKWNAEGEDATVVFSPVGKPDKIEVKGKVESVDKKFEFNSLGIGTDASGRPAIKNLQLKGKTMRIVFE